MSLINEALKKAQRQRHDEQAGFGAPMPGGGTRVVRRQKSLSTQTLVLLAGGGIALFVVCVVGAVLWINQPAPAKPAPNRPAASSVTSAPLNPPPVVATPAPIAPKPSAPVVIAPAEADPPKPPIRLDPAPAAALTSMASARSEPIVELAGASNPEPSPRVITVPNLPAGKFEERIQAIVDGWRVAGIRSSSTGSRVLLNERVYKLNDVVDRANGLRLTKIASDQLTFTTAEGVDYVKTF